MYEKASKGNRVAVFVDGDNLAASHATAILKHAASLGDVFLTRVYGNLQHCTGWASQPGFRALHAGEGKNAADMLMTVDVMEVAMTGTADSFVIATADRDFTHVVQRLRDRCLRVTVIGEDKAPDTLRKAGTEFIRLEAVDSPCPATERKPDALERLVFELLGKKGASMSVQQLNQAAQKAKLAVKQTWSNSWREWLEKREHLFDHGSGSDGGQVRLRS